MPHAVQIPRNTKGSRNQEIESQDSHHRTERDGSGCPGTNEKQIEHESDGEDKSAAGNVWSEFYRLGFAGKLRQDSRGEAGGG